MNTNDSVYVTLEQLLELQSYLMEKSEAQMSDALLYQSMAKQARSLMQIKHRMTSERLFNESIDSLAQAIECSSVAN